MELEGKMDALRALELKIFRVTPSLAECCSFLKWMMNAFSPADGNHRYCKGNEGYFYFSCIAQPLKLSSFYVCNSFHSAKGA